MIPILGKPLMEYLIEHLARHGHHRNHDQRRLLPQDDRGLLWRRESLGRASRRFEGGMTTRYRSLPKGSAGGMKAIQDFSGFFDETTLVICGDAIIDLDITAALLEHHSVRALASVVTLEVPNDQVQNYGVVVADQAGKVECFQEKPAPAEASPIGRVPAFISSNPRCSIWCPPALSSTSAASCFPCWPK